ncbi:zinc-binding alcohol dehydrogenase family protein [Streptomyces plumbiresistens]|uniref:Zinc-binding dehydrogenase n=1 Tax=Streptomyces plumbiresistens TaxID=511811 RepID=A0ABP7SB94_9ACTN
MPDFEVVPTDPMDSGDAPTRVRAAIVDHPGAAPRIGVIDAARRRKETTLVRVLGAALNPLDISIAAGLVPVVRHEEPYVPGIECTGVVVQSDQFLPGDPVYGECHPSPTSAGCFASHVVLSDTDLLSLPAGVDPVQAVAVGNSGVAAFLPLVELGGLRKGDGVLILGATGAVGKLAVQISREHGAGRIVAVGRDATALEQTRALGAHATVELQTGEGVESLADRLRAAAPSIDLVLDGLFGTPLEAALRVCGPRARVVNIGNSVGPEISLSAGLLRGRQVSLTGFAGFYTPLTQKRLALEWLWGALMADRLHLDVVRRPLDDLPAAWADQQGSPHTKTVIVPDAQILAGFSRRR